MTSEVDHLVLFLQEAHEQLEAVSEYILDLERGQADAAGGRECRRALHSVKGNAGMSGLNELMSVIHELEELFPSDHGKTPEPESVGRIIELFHRVNGLLEQVALKIEGAQASGSGQATPGGAADAPPEDGAAKAVTAPRTGVSLRFEIERLDSVGTAFDSIRDVNPTLARIHQNLARLSELQAMNTRQMSQAVAVLQGLKVEMDEDPLGDRVGRLGVLGGSLRRRVLGGEPLTGEAVLELVREVESLARDLGRARNVQRSTLDGGLSLLEGLGEKSPSLAPVQRKLRSCARDLERQMTEASLKFQQLRMIPIEQIFGRFRRQGRELSSRLRKDVDFVYETSDAEVDGSYMDILSEPLLHILRNAMDHGMEDAGERVAQGKPARGRMEISAEFSPDAFKLLVRDDGRGIDPTVVRRKIVEKGLVSEHEASRLTAPQVIEWIFHPGFSTRDEASEISGRGVGMNVIRERITQAGGALRLHSVPRKGTTLEILLPMGLTTLDAILVEEDGQLYGIPLSSALGVLPSVERKISTRWREHEIPVLDLRECLIGKPRGEEPPTANAPAPVAGRPAKAPPPPAARPGVVLGRALEPALCICVDRLMGKRKLIYRTLGEPLRSLALYGGGSVLSSGASVLILDPRVLASSTPVTEVTAS